MKNAAFFVMLSVVSGLLIMNAGILAQEISPALPPAVTTEAESPDTCVDMLHQTLIQAMKLGETTACARRYRLLEPALSNLFNFDLTCRLVLGRHWKKLTPDKKKEFVDAFSTMSIATYADRFNDYANEKFIITGTKQIKKNRAVVKTVLVTSKGEEIPLDYICVNKNGIWKIVTVAARGVNDLALKKAEYTSFLKTKNIDALITFLKRQAEKCIGHIDKNLT